MKRVSQREETGSGWRERPEGKEEQSAERLGLAKKKKTQKGLREEERKKQRESILVTFEKEGKKKKSKMTNGIANGVRN